MEPTILPLGAWWLGMKASSEVVYLGPGEGGTKQSGGA